MERVSNNLKISGDSLVKEIQDQFTLVYPYLKLELCKAGDNTPSFRQTNASPQKKIKELTNLVMPGYINICGNRTVAELEQEFHDRLGLYVQLFRKSGNVWNSISLTDSWTLENQNKAGEFISTEMTSVVSK